MYLFDTLKLYCNFFYHDLCRVYSVILVLHMNKLHKVHNLSQSY